MGFEITRRTGLSAADAWARLTDWPRHSGLIPFTQVERLPGPVEGVGSRFTARTSVGPFHFDDPMEVTFWQRPEDDGPGVCRIVKRGTVIVGWAVLTITPDPVTGGATVSWREEADVRRAGPLLAWPNAVAGRKVFTRLVDALLAD